MSYNKVKPFSAYSSMTKKSSTPISLCIGYSAPHITATWLVAPMGVIQGVYAMYYGLSLNTIAAVVFFARIFDAVTDPLIGYLNDRYFQHAQTRKPFIWAGGLLCIFSSYFLYVPFDFVLFEGASKASPQYFTCWFIFFFLAWTLFEIPHIAWANELTYSAKDKTKIFSFRATAYYMGIMLFYVIPLLPFFETSDITPETLRVSVISAGAMMLIFLYYSLTTTPDIYCKESRNRHHNIIGEAEAEAVTHPQSNRQPSKKFLDLHIFLKSLINNKPFVFFISAFLFKGMGTGMFYGLFFIYIDAYLGLGHQFAKATLLGFVVGILAIPVWHRLVSVLGKKITWVLGMALIITGLMYIHTFVPGTTQFLELMVSIALLNVGFACMSLVAPAMLSEIVNYSTWKYGVERSASYFSLYTFVSKASAALATSLGLLIAGWYGLDATSSTHDEDTVRGLTLAMTWIPIIFVSLAIFFITLCPINDRRHAIIRCRLDSRSTRTGVI